MKKNLCFLLSMMTLALTGCETVQKALSPRAQKRQRHLVYHKNYETSQTLLEQIGDPENFDSTAVYQKNVGQTFHNTFSKKRGYSQSSRYNPADF